MDKVNKDNLDDFYQDKFKAGNYIEEYYHSCKIGFRFWMTEYFNYFSKELKKRDSGHQVLDFGCGPVVIYTAAAKASSFPTSITYADLVEDNRQMIDKWMKNSKDALDWERHFNFIEKISNKRSSDIKRDLRAAYKEVVACDVNETIPIPGKDNYFDAIMTNLCLEYACTDIDHMKKGIKNISNMLQPGGIFMYGGALECTQYSLAGEKYPACSLTPVNIKEMFYDPDMGMQLLKLKVMKINADQKAGSNDNSGIFFLVAQKMGGPKKEVIEEEVYMHQYD